MGDATCEAEASNRGAWAGAAGGACLGRGRCWRNGRSYRRRVPWPAAGCPAGEAQRQPVRTVRSEQLVQRQVVSKLRAAVSVGAPAQAKLAPSDSDRWQQVCWISLKVTPRASDVGSARGRGGARRGQRYRYLPHVGLARDCPACRRRAGRAGRPLCRRVCWLRARSRRAALRKHGRLPGRALRAARPRMAAAHVPQRRWTSAPV